MASRRTLLIVAASAAVGGSAALGTPFATAASASTGDTYTSNSALYADTAVNQEGVDYGRRYKRHGVTDPQLSVPQQPFPQVQTVILAPHGGGIELGTSELCLAIAGYDPATLTALPGAPTYDYWMFEGLRSSGDNPGNGDLHVTSTHCDDFTALSLAGGARHAVALHGCTTAAASLPAGAQAVLVGGRNAAFKGYAISALTAAGITATDASNHPDLNGTDPANIANRTLLGMGLQLEITTPLRTALFEAGYNNRLDRPTHRTAVFGTFVTAIRASIAQIEATTPIV